MTLVSTGAGNDRETHGIDHRAGAVGAFSDAVLVYLAGYRNPGRRAKGPLPIRLVAPESGAVDNPCPRAQFFGFTGVLIKSSSYSRTEKPLD